MKFGFKQREFGGNKVCTCCNTVVAAGAKKEIVDEHELHDDCCEKLKAINAVKKDLQPVIDALPENFFKRTFILERLENAYTLSAFTSAWHALCEHIAHGKSWLAEQFHHAVDLLKQVVERSKIKKILTPALQF